MKVAKIQKVVSCIADYTNLNAYYIPVNKDLHGWRF